MRNKLVPLLHVAVKNHRTSCPTPEEQRVPAPHWVTQSRVPILGREVSTPSGCENQQRLWLSEMRDARVSHTPFKELTHGLTH